MSVEKIRNALGVLQEDPDNESAWADIEEVVTGGGTADAVRELEMARVRHEQLKLWSVVARLLELEIALDEEPDIAAAKQLELGRIYHEELLREDEAVKAFRAGLELRPDDRKAREALGDIEFGRANLDATVEHALVEALDSDDPTVQVPMLLRAAEAKLRYAARDKGTLKEVGDYITQALQADATHHRALAFASLYYTETREWEKLADVLTQRAMHAAARDERVAAAHHLCLVLRNKLEDDKRALDAHHLLLDLDPSNPLALAYLVEHYSKSEQWDELAALYEDQLNAGAVKPSEELGVWVQLAMLNWKTRGKAEQAETYFDKVRKVDAKHAGMLEFFREYCRERGETGRLMGILTEAARAMGDGKAKTKVMSEIAGLAEGEENARRAIEQYKAILRSDPDNEEARDKLKALYLQTESYNALVELYRQDLTRLGKDEDEKRIDILREVAKIYGERMRSDTALLTVLTQILQIDENDIDAVRGLIRVYEALGRWRDLLNMQQKLAELTENQPEKVNLLRAVARRWLDQFSNVQNAISAYEALLNATRDDIEAREKLRELYKKRRAWPKLYELYESQLDAMEGEQRTELMLEMARLASERLDKGDDAIRLLKEVLVFQPDVEGILDQLERQAERQKDFQTMAFVLEKRIDTTDDERSKVQLLQKLGALLSDKIEDHGAAKDAWRRVLELSPGHKRALRVLRQSYVQSRDWAGLETLYASQNDFEGLADFLSTTADRAEDPAERLELSFRAAGVYEGKLAAPERAARSYERVLTMDDKNERAARALLPLYEKEEKWSRLPGLYSILLADAPSVDEKIMILHKVAEITGGPLANKTGALGYARKAYELRADEEGLRRLREWSEQAGDWAPFIDVVSARLESGADMDTASRRELKLMLAGVYASEVEKLDEAVEMYRSLLEEDPGDTETAQELERLLRAADRRDDLRWLFALRAERFEGEARADAFEEWAIVEEEVFGEPEKAAELLRQVVEIEPERLTALSALTRLQLAADDYRGAAATLEAQRDASEGDERLEIETRLAEIYLDHLD
ncbi:MAG TPA: tetratricopeptide repeat protein, partial [Polyangiaceae bacterium]|nr:tetratricopeptide repeat protein [Polyangiaceae bacterium]